MYGTTAQRGDGTPERVQRGSWSRHGDHQHGVQFYSQDSFLLEELSEYIGDALRVGDAAVVVATETHRNSLLQWLTSRGLDIAALVEQERLVVTDAAQLLETFMRDGWRVYVHELQSLVKWSRCCGPRERLTLRSAWSNSGTNWAILSPSPSSAPIP
jgi:hypothetical protein